MIIQLYNHTTPEQIEKIQNKVAQVKFKSTLVKTQNKQYLVCLGKGEFDIRHIGQTEGIEDIFRVSDNYKLVSSKWKVNPTIIDLGDGVTVGADRLSIMAGPCSIEDENQIEQTIQHLKENNVSIMRGGVYKPRSSPYSFRGHGLDMLKKWHSMAQKENIKIITEVMQPSQIEEMYDYVDIYQVGARNTQNFNLLDELGKVDKPVLIKRGISGTIEELLSSAEYIFSAGNEKLILCERGIRTYENASRNTMDINAIPILKEKSHLPVIADPSHGIGIRKHVEDISLACIMGGADGVIYETHPIPTQAASDGQQTLDFSESTRLISRLRKTYDLKKSF